MMLTLLNAYNYNSGSIPPRKLVCLHLSASPVELKQHKMVKLDLSLLRLSRDHDSFSPKYGKLAISKASKKNFPLKKHILCELIDGLLFSQRYLPIS